MKICSGRTREIVRENIKEKRSKIIQPINDIRRMSRMRKMKKVGTIRMVKLLIQSQIVPIITYGCEAWINLTEEDYKEAENIFKQAICNTMSLPMSTNHEALLYEVGNVHMEAWLDVTKIKFANRILHEKKHGKCYRMLREEICSRKRGGFIENVEQLCTKYRLPNITLHYARPQDISTACREWSLMRQFTATIMLKSLPMIFTTRKYEKEHWNNEVFTNAIGRAIACFNTGNLIMKSQNPHKMRLKDSGDRSCLFPGCGGEDTYKHVQYSCQFYSTKYKNNNEAVLDNAKFLVELNEERRLKFKTPLIVPLPVL